jgi:hypothetical protein
VFVAGGAIKRIFLTAPIVATLIAFAIPTAAFAKAPTVRITISGGRLARTIAITDPRVLKWSDVYAGNFLDTTRAVRERVTTERPRYEITYYIAEATPGLFHLSWLHHTKARKVYVVYYQPDVAEGRGYVYLPGNGEPLHDFNNGTIIRPGLDGKWVAAASPWDALINSAIARAETR